MSAEPTAYDLRYDNWVSAQSLPDTKAVIAAANTLLDSTTSWQSGKKYHGIVNTLNKKVQGEASWYVRLSEHSKEKDGIGFEDLWWALGVDHSIHESEYVPELKKATLLSQFEQSKVEAWNLYYKFPPPISPRGFDVLVIIDRPNPKEAIIISLPYQLNDEETKKVNKAVKGKYCSFERIKELEGGKVEWRMAVQSSAAGLIPGFIQEMSMASKISDDVPFVQKWLKTHPTPAPASTDAPETAPAA